MPLTWNGLPVVLTWQSRIRPPRREWAARFGAAVAASERDGHSESALAVRIQRLANDLEARAVITHMRAAQAMLVVRLETPAISYFPGAGPRGARSRTVIEFVDGPRAGERDKVDILPDTIAADGSSYRRLPTCAIDRIARYVWEGTPPPSD